MKAPFIKFEFHVIQSDQSTQPPTIVYLLAKWVPSKLSANKGTYKVIYQKRSADTEWRKFSATNGSFDWSIEVALLTPKNCKEYFSIEDFARDHFLELL